MINPIVNGIATISLAGTIIYLIIRQYARIENLLGQLDCRNIDGHNGRDYCGQCLECTRSANKSLAKSMSIAQERVVEFEQRERELREKIVTAAPNGNFAYLGIIWHASQCPLCQDTGMRADLMEGENHIPDGDPIPQVTCGCKRGLELERLYAIATEHEGCIKAKNPSAYDCGRRVYEWAVKMCQQHSGHIAAIFIPKSLTMLWGKMYDDAPTVLGDNPIFKFPNDSVLTVYQTECLTSMDLAGARWNFVGASGITDEVWWEKLTGRATRSGHTRALREEPIPKADEDLAS